MIIFSPRTNQTTLSKSLFIFQSTPSRQEPLLALPRAAQISLAPIEQILCSGEEDFPSILSILAFQKEIQISVFLGSIMNQSMQGKPCIAWAMNLISSMNPRTRSKCYFMKIALFCRFSKKNNNPLTVAINCVWDHSYYLCLNWKKVGIFLD